MVGFSNVKGETMKYKMKAFLTGVTMLAIVAAIAGFVNALMLILGTDMFLTGFAVLSILYLCYVFGDLYLSIYASKEKSDA
jgi:membrane protein implicated in regulation of membrane protease activity